MIYTKTFKQVNFALLSENVADILNHERKVSGQFKFISFSFTSTFDQDIRQTVHYGILIYENIG